MSIGVEALPVCIDQCNLWVGFEVDLEIESWKVYCAEKPYVNYTLEADSVAEPTRFSFLKKALILKDVDTENRVLIRGVAAGRQYKVQLIASGGLSSKSEISREVFTPGAHGEVESYLELIATVVSQEVNSSKGEVILTWDDTSRDENGYDVEYTLGGSGQVNTERLISGVKSFTVSNLESKKYQFKLKKYDIDSNAVEFISNIVLVPNRASPAIPLFNSSMLTWEDQGPNSANNQIVKVQISIPTDAQYIQVIAVSGIGTRSSERISTEGYYMNAGVADNQVVSYKLRAIDANGNYADSNPVSLTIEKRTKLMVPSITG